MDEAAVRAALQRYVDYTGVDHEVARPQVGPLDAARLDGAGHASSETGGQGDARETGGEDRAGAARDSW